MMRLSEAIRLGAMLSEQGFGDHPVGSLKRCALEAAADAVAIQCRERSMGAEFPILNAPVFQHLQCPECHGAFCSGIAAVIAFCLNDVHKWTREKIAAWVETMENSYYGPPQPVTIDVTPNRAGDALQLEEVL